jgi:tRNA threonylcarbamoyladenosine biosynthesis protein TsaE
VRVGTQTAEETEELGKQLASARPGDQQGLAVIYLTGDLGAGKTTFARGVLHGLGETGAVRSPTYTLLELHELAGLTVLHVDLYRLQDQAELESLGLRDWARPGCLWLIEWPERAGSRLPPPDLIVTFTVGTRNHAIEAQARSPVGKKWLESLAHRSPGGADAPAPEHR